MATITNPGKQPKGFFRPSTGELVELEKGQSAEVSSADLAKLKQSPAFSGFEIDGDDADDAPAPKPKRGRKPKADAGDEKPDNGEDDGDNPDATGGE